MTAIVTKLQRWSPTTCDCVIELETDYDNVLVKGMNITEPKFILLNRVCEKHIPLASTEFRDDHPEQAANVLDILEKTKARNLQQVDDLIANATRILEKRDLEIVRQQVLTHNGRITEEWEELVTFTHAFDNHIHERIKNEQNG